MKNLLIFGFGTAYGLLMRLAFGFLPFLNQPGKETASGPMLLTFVFLVPFLIGIYTLYAESKNAPGILFALFGPWIPTLCFVGGTALLLIEGSICIAMALPIFCFAASLGGLVGWFFFSVL